jgi:hypothetical protein
VQLLITDPKSYFAQHGGLHDACIREIVWNLPARFISIEVADLNANALGFPEYAGAEPGTLLFHDAEQVTLNCDAFVNDIQRVYDVVIEKTGAGKYQCTLLISPGGRLTFGFTALTLIAGSVPAKATS